MVVTKDEGDRVTEKMTERPEALVDERPWGRFERLAAALVDHANGLVSADPTIGTCWDADRLHLPRVGIRPRRELVSTEAAWGEAPAAAAELLRTAGAPSWVTLVVSVTPRP